MGNTVVPGPVLMCADSQNSLGLFSSCNSERWRRSVLSPLRMAQNMEDGGANGENKKEEPSEEESSAKAQKTEVNSPEEEQNRGPEDKEAMKSIMHKLKALTGYSYAYCKKALDKTNNNLEEAVKWLEGEGTKLGLEKLSKIDGRRAAEGMVGVAWERQHAAMVEVNSETDFVSNNNKFHELVDLVAKTCLRHTKDTNPTPKALSKVVLKEDEIGKLVAEDKHSLSEHLTKTVALLGEKLRLRRAALISSDESARLAVLTHGAESTYKDQGRLGTVLVYKAENYEESNLQLAKHICQQIIAMNPKSIHPLEGQRKDAALLEQTFILDSSKKVGDMTSEAHFKIEDFVRFDRGEPGEDPDELGTGPVKPLC